MSGRGLVIAAAAPVLVVLVLFATFNKGQVLALDFGLWTWEVDAIAAVYAGIFAGLAAMFLLGLPADLAARGERERLASRVRQLERSIESESGREG